MALPHHYNNRTRIYFCDPLPRWGLISPHSTSCQSDTGHYSDERRSDTKSTSHEIPILKSSYTIHISYTPLTFLLTWMAIMTSLHTLLTLSYSSHTFPPIFVLFHMLFHLSHLVAHLFGVISFERFCIVYGTSLYWTGWLIGMFVFRSERIPLDFTVVAFWLLVLERRNAWGLVVWEFVSQLEDIANNQAVAFGSSIRLIVFRIWCVFGVGSAWALVYLPLAVRDGFVLASLLSPTNVIRLFFVSAVGGLGMICFWSFWTFQYRGVVWQREMRKGIAVWCSDGIARAADIM